MLCGLIWSLKLGMRFRNVALLLFYPPSLSNYYQKVAIVCPITRTVRASRFDVAVPEGLAVHGFIRVDQVKSLDWRARKAVFEARMPDGMPDDIVDEVSDIVEAIIWAE